MPRPPEVTPPANSATMRAFVHWIRAAAPYVHAFRGKTFVIAFGGEVVADDSFLGVVHDINLLVSLGIRLVVVHGCRPQVEAILKQQSIPSRYAHGMRVTDAEAMDCVLEAAGQVRARIEAMLSLGLANSPMADALLKKPDKLAPDVRLFLPAAIRACDNGVKRAHLISRHHDGALLLELFTRDGVGTMLAATALAHIRSATIDDVGGIISIIEPLEEQGVLVRRSRERFDCEMERFIVAE